MAREKFVRFPDGREFTFPVSMSDAEIQERILDELFGPIPTYEIPEAVKPEAGFFGGFKEGITSLGGLPEAASYLASPTAETRGAVVEGAESPYQFQRLEDVESVGQGARLFRELAGQSIGFMTPPLAAAAAAGAVSGPAAPIVAPLTFLGVAGLQYLTETTGRNAQVQEEKAAKGETTEPPDVTKIVASSAAQAGVDLIPFATIFKPVGRLFGLAGRESAEKVARETIETFEKEGLEAAAKKLSGLNPSQSMALGFGAGAVVEGVQEPLQALLERWGAGLDLSSDEALKEYMEAAILGPILGGPFGAISTGVGNVQRGLSNKDFINRLQAEVEGRPIPQDQLAKDWDRQKAEILKTAEPISLVDEEGKPQKITPELLETIGVSPNAKAISVGSSSISMPTLLEKDVSDKGVQTILAGMFQRRMGQVSQEIKQKGSLMSQEERESKLAEYVQAAKSFKSILNIANPENAINSPTNFIVQPSPAEPDKFVLFNPVTSQIAKGKDGKERQYSSLQYAERALNRLIGKEVSEIGKKIDVATQPEKAAEAKKAEKEKKLAEIEDPFAKPATPETAAKTPPSAEELAQVSEKAVVGTEEPVGPVDEGGITGDLDEISFKPPAEPTPTPTAEPTPTPTAEPAPIPTAEPTPTPTAEKIVETPGTDPIGFARLQALMSFDNRNSPDYSSPEEAIDFGLDNLNDTLTEYNVTDPYIREQAVEAYQNEITRLEKEAAPKETKTTETKTEGDKKLGRLNEYLAKFKPSSPANFPMIGNGIWEAIRKHPAFKSLENISGGAQVQALYEVRESGVGTPFKYHKLTLLARGKDGQIYRVAFDLGMTTAPPHSIKQKRSVELVDDLQVHWPGDIYGSDGSFYFHFVGSEDAKKAAEKFGPKKEPTETKTTEKKPRKPRTKKIQTPGEVIHMPPPAEVTKSRPDMIADQIAALDGEDGGSGEFNDIAEAARGMKDGVKLDKVLDIATRLKNAYDTAQGKRAGVSEADRNAAAAQINKIYDELDALQSGEIPVTPEGVKAAMEKNGNAKEAEKIASESRKDICE